MKFYCLIPAVTAFLFLSSCGKDKDTVPPRVTISSPANGASYNIYDLISVKAEVSDESDIDFISIRLVDGNLQPVMPPETIKPDGREYSVNHTYELYDIHVETGTYYLRVRASDGSNEMEDYAKVNITGIPLARTGVMLVSTPNANAVAVDLLNNNYSLSPFLFVNTSYGGSSVSSYYQYVNVCSNAVSGSLKSYKISNKAVQWSVSSSPGNFEDMRMTGELSYACFRNGTVRGYDEVGSIRFDAVSATGYYPARAWMHHDEVFVQEEEIGGPLRNLRVYYKGSGTDSDKGILNLPFTVVEAVPMDEDRLFLFGNDGNGQGNIYLLGTNGSPYFYNTPYFSFPAGTIYDAVAVNNDIYLIAHTNGIYLYRYSFNSLTAFGTFPGAQALAYDHLHNEVLASDGAQVKVWDYPATYSGNETVKATVPAANVRDLHVLYNK